jgi:hypothetical protein
VSMKSFIRRQFEGVISTWSFFAMRFLRHNHNAV